MVALRIFAIALWLLPIGTLSRRVLAEDREAAQSLKLAAAGDAIYAYTDDRGRLVHAQRLDDIPQRLRSAAVRADVPEEASERAGMSAWLERLIPGAAHASAPTEPVLYRYRGSDGRYVYTNLWASVPLAQREHARIDLRTLSVNSELGRAVDQQLEQRYEVLQASDTCTQLRAAAREPWWSRASLQNPEHRPLVLCGGVLLLLVLGTPFMLSRGWGAPWARVLQTATPVMLCLGFGAFMLARASHASSALSERAATCDAGTWQQTKDLPQRLQIVQGLEAQRRALAQIEAEAR